MCLGQLGFVADNPSSGYELFNDSTNQEKYVLSNSVWYVLFSKLFKLMLESPARKNAPAVRINKSS